MNRPLVHPPTSTAHSIYLNFNELGSQVLRVVVSDMKGGIASRNLILKVGDGNTINQSMVTGTVRGRAKTPSRVLGLYCLNHRLLNIKFLGLEIFTTVFSQLQVVVLDSL